MRKRLLFVSLSVPLLLSCSLKENTSFWDSGYFRVGEFVGKHDYSTNANPNDYIDNEAAILIVENISQAEFNDANGIDVIKDINGGKNPFFRLTLKIRPQPDTDYIESHFYNLERHSNHRLEYKDDNRNKIIPGSKSFDDHYSYSILWHFLEDESSEQFYIVFPLEEGDK